ncbi:MFS transporter [Actibacterium mucosum KCTC 23349]|uniref:MFS transporter n=1 Tax=Actibacterium mucosum KCTC 23349 TaxID=1454373 RepID=A0A037ZM14_9RHOB|nr:c-type cytochrome [Actibacterium mucosum]KAJ56689.1 MFS transporter [Actibacterium mucosum KCTC 23349]
MSKPLSQIFLPAIGGTALMLAVAVVVAERNYGDNQIATLERQVVQVSERAEKARATGQAEAARVGELEAEIAEIQAAAALRVATGSNLTAPAPEAEGAYGLGRAALVEEIAAWDVDVLPDGRGLPEGKGDVWTGEEVFADRCASCHGDFAEGVDNWPVLAGGFDTLGDEDPVKTVGSYWPHLSTAWDYISRSMPFGEAGTLTADETYAIVAYILYSNDLVDEDFELNHENFADFNMYNMDGFVIDDRPDLEYAAWRSEPCMENCKDEVKITMRSVFLVETPPEGGSNSVMNHAAGEELPSFTAAGPSFIPEGAKATQAVAQDTAAPAALADDGADLIADGQKVFKKCAACHKVGEGAKNASGPQLNGIVGRTIGGVEGFKYSKVFQAALEEGRVWDEAALTEFLAKPKSYMKGTKMAFSGLKKETDLTAVIAYLASLGE